MADRESLLQPWQEALLQPPGTSRHESHEACRMSHAPGRALLQPWLQLVRSTVTLGGPCGLDDTGCCVSLLRGGEPWL